MPIASGLALSVVVAFFILVLISPAAFLSYERLLKALLSEETRYALTLSLTTATASTVLSLVVSLPAAYALSRYSFPGKSLAESLLDIPVSLPPVVLGACLLVFFARNPIGALINEKLLPVIFSIPGIVVAQLAVITPITVRMLREVLEAVPPRYEWIARTLGYTQLEAFLRVVLPLTKRGLLATVLLTWSRALGEFGATLMLAGATRLRTETLPIMLYLKFSEGDFEGLVIAMYILIAIVITTTLSTRVLLAKRLKA